MYWSVMYSACLNRVPADLNWSQQSLLLKSLYFRSREYLVRELFQKKWSISGKNGSYTGNDTTEARYDGHSIEIPVSQIRLLGQHNYFDIGIAWAVCRLLNIRDEVFLEGLKTYKPLPHRLQFLGEKNGIKYYDDSISTICETTIQALNTLKDVDAVLIGGMDRGIDYSELIHFLSGHPVPYIILMEATGKRIFEEIRQDYPDFQKWNVWS